MYKHVLFILINSSTNWHFSYNQNTVDYNQPWLSTIKVQKVTRRMRDLFYVGAEVIDRNFYCRKNYNAAYA